MRFLLTIRLTLAIAVTLATVSVGTAQHIGTISGNRLPEVRDKASLGRMMHRGDSSAHMIRNATVLPMLRGSASVDSTTGRVQILEGNAKAAKLDGQARNTMHQLHRFDAIPTDLVGRGIPRVIAPNALPRLQNFYARIVRGDVGANSPRFLTTQDLTSYGLRNGWEFRFLGACSYSFRDLNTRLGFKIWGDPHINSLNKDEPEQHLGDWTSNCVQMMIPGKDADFPTLVLGWSDGTSQDGAWGLPTNLLIVDREQFIWIEGLKTANPTGVVSDGALFAYQAYESEFRRANKLYWVETELRTQTGDRSAPPPHARQYTRKAPTSMVESHQLFGDSFRLVRDAGNGEIPAMDRELFERFRHAKAAADCRNTAIADKANGHADKTIAYCGKQSDYLTERGKLAAQIDDLRKRHDDIFKLINDPLTSPKDKAAKSKELEDLNKELDALIGRWEALKLQQK